MEGYDEGRVRIVAQATRQAVVDDVRRARRSTLAGGVGVGVGVGLAALGWLIPDWTGWAVSVAGIGVCVALFGVLRIARALGTWFVATRRLRGIDARALPSARILKQ